MNKEFHKVNVSQEAYEKLVKMRDAYLRYINKQEDKRCEKLKEKIRALRESEGLEYHEELPVPRTTYSLSMAALLDVFILPTELTGEDIATIIRDLNQR